MNLVVETYSLCKKFGVEKAIELISNAGFDGVDFSFYFADENDSMLDENYQEHADVINTMIKEKNMSCNQAHAPFRLSYGEEFTTNNKHYLEILRAMEFASILGVENIVIHAITVPKDKDLFEYNLNYYKTFEPFCAKFNIHIAIENLFSYDSKRDCYDSVLGTPQELISMIDALHSEWFVVCVDVGHCALTGTEPEQFISKLNHNSLKALHIQDNDYRGDKHWLPYMGNLNWDNITKSLSQIRYNGDFTFEIFNFINKFDEVLLPDALKLAEKTGRYLIDKINHSACCDK